MKERYDELIKLIEKANYDYYTLDNPTVTDREYDNWMSELLDIEERHPEIKRKDSADQCGDKHCSFIRMENEFHFYCCDYHYLDCYWLCVILEWKKTS